MVTLDDALVFNVDDEYNRIIESVVIEIVSVLVLVSSVVRNSVVRFIESSFDFTGRTNVDINGKSVIIVVICDVLVKAKYIYKNIKQLLTLRQNESVSFLSF